MVLVNQRELDVSSSHGFNEVSEFSSSEEALTAKERQKLRGKQREPCDCAR